MRARFSELPKVSGLGSVLVRSASAAGYWGRGASVEEAIANATWIGSQSPVYVLQCDDTAKCDPISGDLVFDQRGPIYVGRVMKGKKDVLVTEVHKQ